MNRPVLDLRFKCNIWFVSYLKKCFAAIYIVVALPGQAEEVKLVDNYAHSSGNWYYEFRPGNSGLGTCWNHDKSKCDWADFAQAFTTGSTSYKLTKAYTHIGRDHTSRNGTQVELFIYGPKDGTVQKLATVSRANGIVSNGGLVLEANTQYFFVADSRGGGTDSRIYATSRDAQDSDYGWTIENHFKYRVKTDSEGAQQVSDTPDFSSWSLAPSRTSECLQYSGTDCTSWKHYRYSLYLQLFGVLPGTNTPPPNTHTGPTVSSVEITPEPTDNTWYVGEDISIKVKFSENVTVDTTNGTPYIEFKMSDNHSGTCFSTQCQADYDSGSDTNTLVFKYTVVSGNESTDGIAVFANKLNVNGGTITATNGGETANLYYSTATTHDGKHKVDGSQTRPSATTPSVSSATITSSPADGIYYVGEKIQFTVVFDEAVTVTGTPIIEFDMGNTNLDGSTHVGTCGTPPQGKTTNCLLQYASGSTTASLVFEYTVASGNESGDGIEVTANSLALDGGTITATDDGQAANLNHSGTTRAAGDPKVDGTQNRPLASDMVAATVSTVAITSAANCKNTYFKGDTIEVTVTFDKDVTVTGTPRIGFEFNQHGGGTKYLVYNSTADDDNDATTLMFTIDVAAANRSWGGIKILANGLENYNGSSITSGNNVDANLAHAAEGPDANHLVFGGWPANAPQSGSGGFGDGRRVLATSAPGVIGPFERIGRSTAEKRLGGVNSCPSGLDRGGSRRIPIYGRDADADVYMYVLDPVLTDPHEADAVGSVKAIGNGSAVYDELGHLRRRTIEFFNAEEICEGYPVLVSHRDGPLNELEQGVLDVLEHAQIGRLDAKLWFGQQRGAAGECVVVRAEAVVPDSSTVPVFENSPERK